MVSSCVLSDDVILDGILPWLPAKSVGRFRCVCKSWYHGTSNPSFIQTHHHHAVQRNHFGFLMGDYLKCGYDCWSRLNGYKLFGSCNGIFCTGKENKVCLMNPCTKEIKFMEFPYPLVDPNNGTSYAANAVHYNMCGFGYDSDEDDYKLVMFECPMHERKTIHIHSLNNTSRTTICDVPCEDAVTTNVPGQGVYVNGSLHWITGCMNDDDHYMIFSFEIKNKMFQKFELPLEVESASCYVYSIGMVGGKLCISSFPRNNSNTAYGLKIWVRLNGSWSKLFTQDESSIPVIFLPLSQAIFSMEDLSKYIDGEILLDRCENFKLFYHPQLQTIRMFEFSGDFSGRFPVISYIVSLTTLGNVGKVNLK